MWRTLNFTINMARKLTNYPAITTKPRKPWEIKQEIVEIIWVSPQQKREEIDVPILLYEVDRALIELNSMLA